MSILWAPLRLFCGILGFVVLGACSERADHAIPSSAMTFGLPHGLCQSPVNIVSAAVEGQPHEISFEFGPDRGTIVHKAHTVEVDFRPGRFVEYDGVTYDFRQFHFHTPAEHLIDWKRYPLEMHMVHTRRDQPGCYLVIAHLFEEGRESEFLASFLAEIPDQPGGEAATTRPVDVRSLFRDLRSFHYPGSLTTPPYSETVRWVVMKSVKSASREQIDSIERLEGDNARRLQLLNQRTISEH